MLCRDGIHRFPRGTTPIKSRFKGHKMRSLEKQVAEGKTPKGYHKLTSTMRRVARRIVAGSSVRDVCRHYHIDSGTFYRWLHFHKPFQLYYYRKAQEYAETVDQRLDAKLPRAVEIIENSLESGDPYFASETAMTLLKGRGKLSTTSKTESKVTGEIRHSPSQLALERSGVDKELLLGLVNALTGLASGGKVLKPKVIDVKALPPAVIEGLPHGSTEVQESQHAEIAR